MDVSGKSLRTALYVDFDNVFLGLRDQDPVLAEVFGRQPERWLSWLAGEEAGAEGAGRRRILLRRCYLNPATFYEYRPHLVRAAFQVIDCPSLTRSGKNAADIQMVMDIFDALAHPTVFDEFVILSGDSDFTPVLLRLRAHDRRTTILALGMTSPAYRAAADLVIGESEFKERGLADAAPEPAPAPVLAMPEPAEEATAQATVPDDGRNIRIRARDAIEAWVAAAEDPMTSSTIAWRLQTELGIGPASRWAGSATFKSLILSLPEHAFAVAWTGPTWFFDPLRHDLPGAQQRPVVFDDPEVEAVARRVASVTDIPLLGVEDYVQVFHLVAEDVSANGQTLADTTRRLRDAAKARGIPLSREDANFIVKGIYYGGLQLPPTPPEAALNPDDLAVSFLRSAESSAAQAQVILMPGERKALERWLAPEPPESG